MSHATLSGMTQCTHVGSAIELALHSFWHRTHVGIAFILALHSFWQCDAVCCSVLQCVAVCCIVLQCVAVAFIFGIALILATHISCVNESYA